MAKAKKSTKSTKAPKVEKVSKEELSKIQELNSVIGRITNAIGQAEVQKTKMLADYGAAQKELQEIGTTLEEKYGRCNISIEDGTITPIEEEPAETEK
tara:strand:- start:2826 stop:3119 length:294 start_codon:yes stop_codon:yes gene_type:complete